MGDWKLQLLGSSSRLKKTVKILQKSPQKKGVKKQEKRSPFSCQFSIKNCQKTRSNMRVFFSSNEGKNSSRMTPKKNPFFSSKRRKQSALMSEKIGKHQICRSKAFPRKYSIDEVLKKISDRKISQKNIRWAKKLLASICYWIKIHTKKWLKKIQDPFVLSCNQWQKMTLKNKLVKG